MEQKAKDIPVQGAEVVKEKKINVSQTLQSMVGNLRKVEKGKLLNEEDTKTLKDLIIKIKEKWIGLEI